MKHLNTFIFFYFLTLAYAFYGSYIWWNVGAVGSLLRTEMSLIIMGPVMTVTILMFWINRAELFTPIVVLPKEPSIDEFPFENTPPDPNCDHAWFYFDSVTRRCIKCRGTELSHYGD